MNAKVLKTWLLILVLTGMPRSAPATFHLVKIVEVFPGTESAPAAQYVLLQMYAPGQNLVAGHALTVFDAGGALLGTFTFSQNLSNGRNLAAILIATADAAALFDVTPDLAMTPVIQAGGGAACWDVVDCVAWGSFSAPAALPVPPGDPFNAPTGLMLGSAMHRDLHSGGSVTPFGLASPAPKNNDGGTGTLTETPTPATGDTPTPTATPTPATPPTCTGDCNGDGQVTVNELLTLVNIALGNTAVDACEAGDADRNNEITITEILSAVNNALGGCPA